MKQVDNLISLIFTVGRQLKEHIKSAKASDLSSEQLQTLRYVHEHPQTLMKDVATYLCIAPPSATTVIDNLVAKHYLQRLPDATDRRLIRLELTAAGKKELSKSFKAIQQHLRQVFSSLDQTEINTFITLLEKISNSHS